MKVFQALCSLRVLFLRCSLCLHTTISPNMQQWHTISSWRKTLQLKFLPMPHRPPPIERKFYCNVQVCDNFFYLAFERLVGCKQSINRVYFLIMYHMPTKIHSYKKVTMVTTFPTEKWDFSACCYGYLFELQIKSYAFRIRDNEFYSIQNVLALVFTWKSFSLFITYRNNIQHIYSFCENQTRISNTQIQIVQIILVTHCIFNCIISWEILQDSMQVI